MSGGSYNYLCFRDAGDILGRERDLIDMAERLDSLCPEAAAETRAFFDGPGSLAAETAARIARLTDLWKAVEWRDSGDWGDDQLAEAVQQYRDQAPPGGQLVEHTDRVIEITRLVEQAQALLDQARNISVRPQRNGGPR